MSKRIVYPVLAILFAVVLPFLTYAQGGPIDPPPFEGDVPIDGGLSLLVAAGVGYGIKKVRDHRKAQVQPVNQN